MFPNRLEKVAEKVMRRVEWVGLLKITRTGFSEFSHDLSPNFFSLGHLFCPNISERSFCWNSLGCQRKLVVGKMFCILEPDPVLRSISAWSCSKSGSFDIHQIPSLPARYSPNPNHSTRNQDREKLPDNKGEDAVNICHHQIVIVHFSHLTTDRFSKQQKPYSQMFFSETKKWREKKKDTHAGVSCSLGQWLQQ